MKSEAQSLLVWKKMNDKGIAWKKMPYEGKV